MYLEGLFPIPPQNPYFRTKKQILYKPHTRQMEFGLTPSETASIRALLAAQPGLRCAWVFGSRALGRQRPGSDVDLALDAPGLGFRDVLALSAALDELGLLLSFDILLLHELDDDSVREHIHRAGRLLYDAEPERVGV